MTSTEHNNEPRYIVITPVRDEATHVAETIESVVTQTVTPIEWIIVDDGSTDDTARIIDRYSAHYPWLSTLHRPNRGVRQNGGGVMGAFYYGYQHLAKTNWEFLVKLDGDLSFEASYFQKCLANFREDPLLGIGGGVIWSPRNGRVEIEDCPRFHVRGATKIYRRACWDAIGGLLKSAGWDTVDELKANMLGWKTRSFPDLQVIQHRPTGAADGAWRNSVKDGRADYISGYHPLFMLLKCVKRMVERPKIIGSLGLLYGFAQAYRNRLPQVDDRLLINYIRQQQIRRLLLLDSIWK